MFLRKIPVFEVFYNYIKFFTQKNAIQILVCIKYLCLLNNIKIIELSTVSQFYLWITKNKSSYSSATLINSFHYFVLVFFRLFFFTITIVVNTIVPIITTVSTSNIIFLKIILSELIPVGSENVMVSLAAY